MLLSGASGFIGRPLAAAFANDGARVVRLARRPGVPNAVAWDPAAGRIDRDALAALGPDIVVNLAGEPIARRWTRARRWRIRASRVNGTRALSEALASLPRKPSVLVSGSGIGYYGSDRGDDVLTELSGPGSDFLASVTREWEAGTAPAAAAGIRVVCLRTAMVIGRGGGAMARMLPAFLAGVGGPLGGGRQWMSWIALTDMVRAIRFLSQTEDASGAFNITAPEPVRNAEFARTLGRVLHRPAAIPAPRFALTAIFGEMAVETILASQRAVPEKLAGAGFEFRHPRLDDALAWELRRSADRAAR